MMRQEKYTEAQSRLASALHGLKHLSDGVSITTRPSTFVCGRDAEQSADTIPLDDWVVGALQDDDRKKYGDGSFFLYGQGIILPLLLPNDQLYDCAASFKVISFVVFFNQGLAYHLPCTCSRNSEHLSTDQRRTMLQSAEQLYKLALQYRKEERSSQGRFLLVVCNNLALLELPGVKASFSSSASTATLGAGFGYCVGCWNVLLHPHLRQKMKSHSGRTVHRTSGKRQLLPIRVIIIVRQVLHSFDKSNF